MEELKKQQPEIKIKPKYQLVYEILNQHGLTIVLLILFIYVAYMLDLFVYYIFFLCLYLLYVVIRAIIRKKKYEKTSFDFYTDKVIYQNSLRDAKEQTLNYSKIKEIRYRQLVLQRFFNIGDILIKQEKEKWFGHKIYIFGVKDVINQYRKIDKLIQSSKNK